MQENSFPLTEFLTHGSVIKQNFKGKHVILIGEDAVKYVLTTTALPKEIVITKGGIHQAHYSGLESLAAMGSIYVKNNNHLPESWPVKTENFERILSYCEESIAGIIGEWNGKRHNVSEIRDIRGLMNGKMLLSTILGYIHAKGLQNNAPYSNQIDILHRDIDSINLALMGYIGIFENGDSKKSLEKPVLIQSDISSIYSALIKDNKDLRNKESNNSGRKNFR